MTKSHVLLQSNEKHVTFISFITSLYSSGSQLGGRQSGPPGDIWQSMSGEKFGYTTGGR